jgi:hypothetical protein
LRRHLDLDDVVLDGVDNQIADGMETEFPHDVAAMGFHGLGAQVQQRGYFLGTLSFRQCASMLWEFRSEFATTGAPRMYIHSTTTKVRKAVAPMKARGPHPIRR